MRFLVVCALLFTLLEALPDALFYLLNRTNAILAAALLKLWGLAPTTQGLTIVLEGFRARVIGECSAVFAAVLPAAFMLAYPAAPSDRLIGTLAAWAALFGVNVLRIGLLVVVGARVPHLFDAIHQYAGQTAMMLLIVAACLVWVRWTKGIEAPRRVGVAVLRCLLCSAGGVIVWGLAGEPYTWFQYRLAREALAWFGIPVQLPAALRLYPDTFLCFNAVTLTVLMGTFSPWRRNHRWLRLWLPFMGLLAVGHLALRLVQLACLSPPVHVAAIWTVNALLLANDGLLPFGLFLRGVFKVENSKTDSAPPTG
jgi:exosortase H (IPTLxxWG-CTERM-specific)